MPLKFEKLKLVLPRAYDRRVRLTDAQREEIRMLHSKGISYQKLADRYGVSKKLCVLVCNPDIAERNRVASMQRHREGRYRSDKETRNSYARSNRSYKSELFKQGLLIHKLK